MITDHPTPTLIEAPLIEDPAERSRRDPVYRAAVIAAVEEGLAELDRGEFFTLEEVEKEIPSWIIR